MDRVQDAFEIGPVRTQDAPGVARCFREVYGETYLHDEVYSPPRYLAAVEAGTTIAVVARLPDGTVGGHIALEREPGGVVAERGEAAVMGAYRGHGLLERMSAALDLEAKRLGLVGVYADPVTVHTITQRNDAREGMTTVGAWLGLAPSWVLPRGFAHPTAGQRQSTLVAFRWLEPPADPARAYAPARYRGILETLASHARVPLQFEDAPPVQPATPPSEISVRAQERLQTGTIRVTRGGIDAPARVAATLAEFSAVGVEFAQLALALDDPQTPYVAEAARTLGFFFAGLGPRMLEGRDALHMEWLAQPIDIAKLQIYSPESLALVRYIEADREGTSAAPAR